MRDKLNARRCNVVVMRRNGVVTGRNVVVTGRNGVVRRRNVVVTRRNGVVRLDKCGVLDKYSCAIPTNR